MAIYLSFIINILMIEENLFSLIDLCVVYYGGVKGG